MYSTCIFCHRDLGSNEEIEEFPVGRRLAFDSATGRLWVVCRRCERWNLSPLETRWEAIEECERRFRDTRLRVSSDNIGLARLGDGLELVRVGAPKRPEFAAWRYGDQFGRRRRRAITYGVAGTAVVGLAVAGGAAAGMSIGGGWWWGLHLIERWKNERTVLRRRNADGEPIRIQHKHLNSSRLVSASDDLGWALSLDHTLGWKRGRSRQTTNVVISGDEALQVAGRLMAWVNRTGGSKRTVRDAVRRIEASGHPDAYLREAAGDAQDLWRTKIVRRRRRGQYKPHPGSLRGLDHDVRLAVEMATQEQAEKEAMLGELKGLEAAWRQAEEIAHIADNLFIPADVKTFVSEERERLGASPVSTSEEAR